MYEWKAEAQRDYEGNDLHSTRLYLHVFGRQLNYYEAMRSKPSAYKWAV